MVALLDFVVQLVGRGGENQSSGAAREYSLHVVEYERFFDPTRSKYLLPLPSQEERKCFRSYSELTYQATSGRGVEVWTEVIHSGTHKI